MHWELCLDRLENIAERFGRMRFWDQNMALEFKKKLVCQQKN